GEENMGTSTPFPVKLLGWVALGAAFGVGIKLGSHLVDMVMGETDAPGKPEDAQSDEPLWKRRFDRVS
ncbi:MAG: hypothetical protein V2B18_00110, partial [Pseudomonadota bacterium]